MTMPTFHRDALAWPRCDSAGADFLAASDDLEIASAQWHLRWQDQPEAGDLLRAHVRSHESQCRARLEHRLSDTWMALRPTGYDHDHQGSHIDPARQHLFEAHFDSMRRAGMSFTEALCSSGSVLLGGFLAPRTTEIGLCRGKDGMSVMFGPASGVRGRLEILGDAIDNSDWPPATTAVLAMAILLNIHPFDDGNGRVARALFQCIARGGDSAGRWPPLPWRALITTARGGFDLSLREVEILGRWTPLIEHIGAMFRLLADVPVESKEVRQRENA